MTVDLLGQPLADTGASAASDTTMAGVPRRSPRPRLLTIAYVTAALSAWGRPVTAEEAAASAQDGRGMSAWSKALSLAYSVGAVERERAPGRGAAHRCRYRYRLAGASAASNGAAPAIAPGPIVAAVLEGGTVVWAGEAYTSFKLLDYVGQMVYIRPVEGAIGPIELLTLDCAALDGVRICTALPTFMSDALPPAPHMRPDAERDITRAQAAARRAQYMLDDAGGLSISVGDEVMLLDLDDVVRLGAFLGGTVDYVLTLHDGRSATAPAAPELDAPTAADPLIGRRLVVSTSSPVCPGWRGVVRDIIRSPAGQDLIEADLAAPGSGIERQGVRLSFGEVVVLPQETRHV